MFRKKPNVLASTQNIVLKGQQDGITITLDPQMPFSDLKEQFRERVKETGAFFEGAKTNVSFTGRQLTNDEEGQLIRIMLIETEMDIPFVIQEGLKQSDATIAPIVLPPEPTAVIPRLPPNLNNTIYHQGALRNGQSIRHAGSVVILGDANPGSEIIAEGHVIVLGSLRGLVHAGCVGNEECFVSGLVFWPTQLRIANVITYIPNDKKKKIPSCAYIQDGQVFVAPLMNTWSW